MNPDQPPSPILEQYLAELEQAAAALPANRRTELIADVACHIAVARAETHASGEAEDVAAVHRILAQLGDPQEIAAAALADAPETVLPAPVSRRPETIAVVLLLFGGFLAVNAAVTSGRFEIPAGPTQNTADTLIHQLTSP